MAKSIFGGLFSRMGGKRLKAKGSDTASVPSDDKIDRRDVLVCDLRNREQLRVCLGRCFYHIPAPRLDSICRPEDVKYIAIFQSRKLFGSGAGICHWGPVASCELLPRREITEIPKDSDEPYYRFRMADWWELTRPIAPGRGAGVPGLTSRYLLERSAELPELWLGTEAEFYLYGRLRRVLTSPALNLGAVAFQVEGAEVTVRDGVIRAHRDGVLLARSSVDELRRDFYSVFALLRDALLTDL